MKVSNPVKQVLKAGTVLAVGALTLGSTSGHDGAAKFVAKTNTLSAAPYVKQAVAPVVEEAVVQVTPAGPVVQAPTTNRKAAVGINWGLGDLERIARCESGGSYTAQNSHSSASGKYQYLDSSWGGYGGYQHAKDAPPSVQDQKAKQDYARSGSRPWAASAGCWGR